MIYNNDCKAGMKLLTDNSIDSVVTDPPYGISFMGKKWDYQLPGVDVWQECYRVLKPGACMLVACGTRTQHRMCVNIEDAGFEIRDIITWHYGSGFPKSLDISKAIDKAAGAERKVIGSNINQRINKPEKDIYEAGIRGKEAFLTAPATEEAEQWQGWGTALKPATELWTLARKPLAEATVAANVLNYGTGGINIDGCRIGEGAKKWLTPKGGIWKTNTDKQSVLIDNNLGRFPANLILDEFSANELDKQSGITTSQGGKPKNLGNDRMPWKGSIGPTTGGLGDTGGASRFFYVAKASKADRGEGNTHPTVKPVKLMQYLVRLITPPNGIVLEPFAGSGSTLVACIKEGFKYVAYENDKHNYSILINRIAKHLEI